MVEHCKTKKRLLSIVYDNNSSSSRLSARLLWFDKQTTQRYMCFTILFQITSNLTKFTRQAAINKVYLFGCWKRDEHRWHKHNERYTATPIDISMNVSVAIHAKTFVELYLLLFSFRLFSSSFFPVWARFCFKAILFFLAHWWFKPLSSIVINVFSTFFFWLKMYHKICIFDLHSNDFGFVS